MISRATGTADRLRTAADFFSLTQQRLRAATTASDLHAVAGVLDTADFDALPPGAREDLAALYAERLFHITGALHP
jgi:hypothetical protein